MPIAAVFADTQAEPASVYRWLDWLEKELPFPVYRVTAGDLAKEAATIKTSAKGSEYFKVNIPSFTVTSKGTLGQTHMRTCTRDFKIKPLLREFRKLAGIKRGQKEIGVVQWIGISLDEIARCRPARDPWIESRWPLLELRMTRRRCLDWMEAKGHPTPPRSACTFCPFHSNKEWRQLKDDAPGDFQQAVDFEKQLHLRKSLNGGDVGKPYLHRSCIPLDQVDLRTDAEHGQLSLWDDECEGMCGV